MRNIVLAGFMGTGKTAIGKLVARDLNMKYVNTDDMIEKKTGMAINDIFSTKGEPHFRKLEREAVTEASQGRDCVIDTGGGAVIDDRNVADLKANGVVICLYASPEEILKRVAKYTHRPLLNVADPLAEIKRLLKRRAGYYKRADHQIDTTAKSKREVAKEIIGIYKKLPPAADSPPAGTTDG